MRQVNALSTKIRGAGDGDRTRMASLEGWMTQHHCSNYDADQATLLFASFARPSRLGTLWALSQQTLKAVDDSNIVATGARRALRNRSVEFNFSTESTAIPTMERSRRDLNLQRPHFWNSSLRCQVAVDCHRAILLNDLSGGKPAAIQNQN